jgi:hypothetical protein
MPEQRVERPHLIEIAGLSTNGLAAHCALYALQLERDLAVAKKKNEEDWVFVVEATKGIRALTAERDRLRQACGDARAALQWCIDAISEDGDIGDAARNAERCVDDLAALTPLADKPEPSPVGRPFAPGVIIDDTPRPIQSPQPGRGGLPKACAWPSCDCTSSVCPRDGSVRATAEGGGW